MATLSVKADTRQVRRMFAALKADTVSKAANSALNRAATKVRSIATKEISRETSIKPQKKIRDAISIRKSSWRNLRAVVTANPKAFNLIDFVVPSKRKPGAFRKKKGVKAKAWGKGKEYKGAFIGRGKNSGKLLVFTRTGTGRKPIKALSGPSVPRTFIQDQIEKAMDREGRAIFDREFKRNLKFRLGKL